MQNRKKLIRKLKVEFDDHIRSLRREGTFGRNLAIRTMGSSSAYLLGFLLSPIIARIYQPEAYGLFAVFNALVANLSILATLNFINAFVLPKKVKDFIPLVQLTLMVVGLVSVLTLIGLLIFKQQLLTLFNAAALGNLIYFLPMFIFFTGINRCLDYWNVRETEYKKGAAAKVVSVIGAKTFTICIGLFTTGNVAGFIMGDLLSRPIQSYTSLSKSIRQDLDRLLIVSWSKIKEAAFEFRNYPRYNMPANGLIVLATQLPVYLLSFYFGAGMTGHFSLAYSLIAAPIQVLGMSVASVFYQKAVETHQNNPDYLGKIAEKLLNRLVLLGIIPFAVLVVFGDIIFTTVFGVNWQIAGVFAGYMGFMAFTNFISVSLNSLYRVVRKEKQQFYINLAGAALLCLGLFVAIQFGNAHHLVLVFSLASALIHLISIAIACSLTRINPFIAITKLVGGFAVMIAILYILRSF